MVTSTVLSLLSYHLLGGKTMTFEDVGPVARK